MKYSWEMPANPAEDFQGIIGKTLKQSKPWWRDPTQAPQGASNVVVILVDDLGFSDFGCFGGEIATPHIDALAGAGLRFTGYTTVPMCTPARAALLTGKNPHAVGCGWLTHNNPGYPGYQAGEISTDAPTMPELLRGLGYSTYGVGKWHNTADYHVGSASDRQAWPLQRGFDRYYGFIGSETNFFSPHHLIDGNEFVKAESYESDYYATKDWTDRSIQYLRAHQSSSPEKPFFLYLAHNAPHVPLQAPPDVIARYAGVYDQGWDRQRESRFQRQRSMGLIGQDWRLSQANPGVPRWNDVPDRMRPLMSHYMQVYAAMVELIDQEVGRLVAELKTLGVYDNTLIVLTSDNGANSIGGNEGTVNTMEKRISRLTEEEMAKKALQAFDQGIVGGSDTFVAYPVGWANCSNTPFRFYKRTPMNGGIRVPFILSHPARVKDPGALREQWIHVTDTLPTVLEMIGASYPQRFNGHDTRGIDGCSYLEMLENPKAPARRMRQHFELEGNRGMILYPWKIVSLQPITSPIDLNNWLLFHLEKDPTECENLATLHPEILQKLIEEFEVDAQINQVYPLDNRDLRKTLAIPPFLEKKYSTPVHFYSDVETIPMQNFAPLMADRDYTLEAHFEWLPEMEGVIFSIGDNMGGLSVFVQSEEVVVSFVASQGVERQLHWRLNPGHQNLRVEHKALGQRQGLGQLVLNGAIVPETLDMTPTFLRLVGEGFDVGLDRRRKVSADCAGHGVYRYAGKIDRVSLIPGPQAPGSLANVLETISQWD